MFQHILVPLDGSSRAEEVLPLAAHLARVSGASLILLRVFTPPTYISMYPVGLVVVSELERGAKDYLTQVVSSEHLKGIAVHTQVLIGSPVHQLITQFAMAQHVDLIAMRSQGATGFMRLVLGSEAQQIVRHSLVPVLVIRDGSSPSFIHPDSFLHPPRTLVALDGSALAEAALLPAAQFCAALAAPAMGAIHLTRTIQHISAPGDESREQVDTMNKEARGEAETYLKRIEQRFQSGDLASFHLTVTSSVVVHADAGDIWKRVVEESECIGDVAGYSACDIIAMATHGRHGFQHMLEGSITESVLDATTNPLLVVHAQKPEGVSDGV